MQSHPWTDSRVCVFSTRDRKGGKEAGDTKLHPGGRGGQWPSAGARRRRRVPPAASASMAALGRGCGPTRSAPAQARPRRPQCVPVHGAPAPRQEQLRPGGPGLRQGHSPVFPTCRLPAHARTPTRAHTHTHPCTRMHSPVHTHTLSPEHTPARAHTCPHTQGMATLTPLRDGAAEPARPVGSAHSAGSRKPHTESLVALPAPGTASGRSGTGSQDAGTCVHTQTPSCGRETGPPPQAWAPLRPAAGAAAPGAAALSAETRGSAGHSLGNARGHRLHPRCRALPQGRWGREGRMEARPPTSAATQTCTRTLRLTNHFSFC